MAGLTPNDPRFQPGFEDIDTTITAVICQGGYYGSIAKQIAAPSSRIPYIGKNAPPLFVVHGDRDRIVPVIQARGFVKQLREKTSSLVVYAELPYATHTYDLFHSLRTQAVFHGVQAFTTWVMSN